MAKKTEKTLLLFRDTTFGTHDKVCGTCRHKTKYGDVCLAVEIREKTICKEVTPWSYCDLWEKRDEQP